MMDPAQNAVEQDAKDRHHDEKHENDHRDGA
jgi:hypothetical protein